jgi:hypothetical protein
MTLDEEQSPLHQTTSRMLELARYDDAARQVLSDDPDTYQSWLDLSGKTHVYMQVYKLVIKLVY